jgi:nucleoside-diphosphate-sugar epimerase
MKVFISGGGGFIGYRLAQRLLERGTLAGPDGRPAPISQIKLFDAAFPPNPDPRLVCVAGDIADPAAVERALDADTSSVFHLAAVVSGGAEADFDLGYRVNLDGMRLVLERCRKLARPPRLVFASSVAAFGGDLPEVLDDSTTPNPQTSYGAQKVIGEYLVTDFTRKGFVDGRSLRLPTVSVRPGKPNKAASSFASGIIREPLAGVEATCPVAPQTRMWLLSPRGAVAALIAGHEAPASAFTTTRSVNVPGISVTVGAMVESLRRIAGEAVAARVKWQHDEAIDCIVRTWPRDFDAALGRRLGMHADADFDAIVRQHVADALGGVIPGAPTG